MPVISPRYDFLKRDVVVQLDIEQKLLNQANDIQAQLGTGDLTPEVRQLLEQQRDQLLRSARALASNANTTSASATTVVTLASSASAT